MTRRKFTVSFEAKVVLEALKERKSLSELAQQCLNNFEIESQYLVSHQLCFVNLFNIPYYEECKPILLPSGSIK